MPEHRLNTPTFPVGTQFLRRGRLCTVVDIWITRNLAGELVSMRYVAAHEFLGQTVYDYDVTHTGVAVGVHEQLEALKMPDGLRWRKRQTGLGVEHVLESGDGAVLGTVVDDGPNVWHGCTWKGRQDIRLSLVPAKQFVEFWAGREPRP